MRIVRVLLLLLPLAAALPAQASNLSQAGTFIGKTRAMRASLLM